jgi:hypothetical protein
VYNPYRRGFGDRIGSAIAPYRIGNLIGGE